jgi:hypothetical protein
MQLRYGKSRIARPAQIDSTPVRAADGLYGACSGKYAALRWVDRSCDRCLSLTVGCMLRGVNAGEIRPGHRTAASGRVWRRHG